MDDTESLASKLKVLLESGAMPKDSAAILELALAVAQEQPDLNDPLTFRDNIRRVSLVFRELYGQQAVQEARRVATAMGNSALARVIINDLEWMQRGAARQQALTDYDILGTASEPGFDDIALIASHVCQTSIALVSLVETHRQWFKGRVGTEMTETAIEESICIHALNKNSLLVIPDLTQDARTRDNPHVRGSSHFRFYAAAPMVTPAGITIGALCVTDRAPRPAGLTPMQAKILEALARQAIALLELKRISCGLGTPKVAATGEV